MKTEIVKFYGNNIVCVVDDSGQILIVMKPVCDALGLDNDWHVRAISEDEVLGSERCEHTVQIGNDQPRKMICLPLEFLHGWLLKSNSSTLQRQGYHSSRTNDVPVLNYHKLSRSGNPRAFYFKILPKSAEKERNFPKILPIWAI